jgi:hypothetical protein
VAFPHPDVPENRFKEAEFAADLFAVDSGNAEGERRPHIRARLPAAGRGCVR